MSRRVRFSLVGVCAILMLALPSAARAAAPHAFFSEAHATGATTATVAGTVNPGGETTTYRADYDLASSPWCTSPPSGTPANSTTEQTLGFTDSAYHDVSVDLTGLTAGTEYCVAIIATNPSGAETSFIRGRFTGGAPNAHTLKATPTGTTTVAVAGLVRAGGQTTTYKASYGLASSEWCTSSGSSGTPANSTAEQPLGFTDSTLRDVSVDLTGLTAGTKYCVAIVATNPSVVTTANVVSFTAGAPDAATFGVTATGTTTATVVGAVNPADQATTYRASYDVGASGWCQWLGLSPLTPASSTVEQTLGFTDSTLHDVSVNLTGLTPGTFYCAAIVATNPSGTSTVFPNTVLFRAGTNSPPPVNISPPPISGNVAPLVYFGTSPKSLRVSRTGRFKYAFLAAPQQSGKVILKSTKRVKIGSKKRYMKFAAKTFKSATGKVAVKFKLPSRNLKALEKTEKLTFKVTVKLGGKSYTTKLTLKAPK